MKTKAPIAIEGLWTFSDGFNLRKNKYLLSPMLQLRANNRLNRRGNLLKAQQQSSLFPKAFGID
jgi:hypothetical protein